MVPNTSRSIANESHYAGNTWCKYLVIASDGNLARHFVRSSYFTRLSIFESAYRAVVVTPLCHITEVPDCGVRGEGEMYGELKLEQDT